jgi:hypothetical protein
MRYVFLFLLPLLYPTLLFGQNDSTKKIIFVVKKRNQRLAKDIEAGMYASISVEGNSEEIQKNN